jgi:hypothetical protein
MARQLLTMTSFKKIPRRGRGRGRIERKDLIKIRLNLHTFFCFVLKMLS